MSPPWRNSFGTSTRSDSRHTSKRLILEAVLKSYRAVTSSQSYGFSSFLVPLWIWLRPRRIESKEYTKHSILPILAFLPSLSNCDDTSLLQDYRTTSTPNDSQVYSSIVTGHLLPYRLTQFHRFKRCFSCSHSNSVLVASHSHSPATKATCTSLTHLVSTAVGATFASLSPPLRRTCPTVTTTSRPNEPLLSHPQPSNESSFGYSRSYLRLPPWPPHVPNDWVSSHCHDLIACGC